MIPQEKCKMSAKYHGVRKAGVCSVYSDFFLLEQRQDLWNHSPDGFHWGYGGSGLAQLALALLADFTGDDEFAVKFHQQFKREYIANLQDDEWVFAGDQLYSMCAQMGF